MVKKGGDSGETCICCLFPLLLIVILIFPDEIISLLKFVLVIVLIAAILVLIIHVIQRQKQKEFEREQRAKGLVKFKNHWGTPTQVQGWMEIDTGLSDNFASLTPYQFEEFIAKLFRKMGYSTTVTPGSGDYGADVIAQRGEERVLIECKRYSHGNNVTPKEVQRTLGALWKHKCDKAVFITTSDFTVKARDLEGDGPIELWNKKRLHQMVRKYFIEDETGN